MGLGAALGALWAELCGMHRDQRVLRGLVLLAAVVFAWCEGLAGDPGGPGLVAVVAVGVLTAIIPHGLMPLIMLLYLGLSWFFTVEDDWSVWLLPAAAMLLLVHTATALAVAAPWQAGLPTPLWRRYAARMGWVLVPTTLTWAVAGVMTGADLPGGMAASTLALGLLAALALAFFLRLPREETGAGSG